MRILITKWLQTPFHFIWTDGFHGRWMLWMKNINLIFKTFVIGINNFYFLNVNSKNAYLHNIVYQNIFPFLFRSKKFDSICQRSTFDSYVFGCRVEKKIHFLLLLLWRIMFNKIICSKSSRITNAYILIN